MSCSEMGREIAVIVYLKTKVKMRDIFTQRNHFSRTFTQRTFLQGRNAEEILSRGRKVGVISSKTFSEGHSSMNSKKTMS